MISTTEVMIITTEATNPTTIEVMNGDMMNMAEAITIEDMTTALEIMIVEEVTKGTKGGDARRYIQ